MCADRLAEDSMHSGRLQTLPDSWRYPETAESLRHDGYLLSRIPWLCTWRKPYCKIRHWFL